METVTAFLAFVPKTAGFVSIILLLSTLGAEPLGQIAAPLAAVLWIIAALTMTVGNVMGLLQSNVKRVLAYSSIAHSGYMLVGLMGGVPGGASRGALGNGVGAVLFYLVAYGLATLAAFAILGTLHRRGEDAETFDDLSGLRHRHPWLATVMLLSVLSLLGLPPMIGFLGKIYLFGSAVQAGYVWLVVIAVINSAISAVYYLRIAGAVFFGPPNESIDTTYAVGGRISATIAGVLALVLGFWGNGLVNRANDAGRERSAPEKPAEQLVHAANAGDPESPQSVSGSGR